MRLLKNSRFQLGDLVQRKHSKSAVWVEEVLSGLMWSTDMPKTPGIVLSIEDTLELRSFVKYIVLIDGDRFIVHEENLEPAT